jgi:casein kinase 1
MVMLTMARLIGICLIVSIITYFVSIPAILSKHTDGKGWEASVVSSKMTYLQSLYLPFSTQGQNQIMAQLQTAGLANPHERRRDDRHRDPERRRASQQGPIIPPSPALVRHGSKQRKVPAALTPGNGTSPGHLTPLSAAAQVNVPVGTQHRGSTQHPYATVGYEYGRDPADESYEGQQQYGRASPMVPSIGAAPPAVSNVRARGGDIGVARGYDGQEDERPPKNSLLKILTCQCG